MSPHVLIVEDETGLLEILELNFRSAGYTVSTAADGVTAWQRYEQQRPDLLVLDLNLPKISGFRLLELVRSESELPVLILTAYDFAEAEEVAQHRPDAFLKKPFDVQELVHTADHLVGRKLREFTGAEIIAVGALADVPREEIRGAAAVPELIEQLKAEYAMGSQMDHPTIRKVFELRYVRRRLRIKAAMLFLVVHSLYKAALFLMIGIVDHETGTREADRLRGSAKTASPRLN